jgi:hypothetical protein
MLQPKACEEVVYPSSPLPILARSNSTSRNLNKEREDIRRYEDSHHESSFYAKDSLGMCW